MFLEVLGGVFFGVSGALLAVKVLERWYYAREMRRNAPVCGEVWKGDRGMLEMLAAPDLEAQRQAQETRRQDDAAMAETMAKAMVRAMKEAEREQWGEG